MRLFHELDSRLEAKLRDYRVETRRAIMREGEVLFSEGIAYIDALFDLEIFDKLHEPSLIGIERTLPDGETVYILFETIAVRPRHYESASLTSEIPPVLKWDYLDRISESWTGGGENWMEIIGVHTGYILRPSDGGIRFEKSALSPLVGSRAHIMSSEVIRAMVCVEDGVRIGVMKGFEIPLEIDIYSIYRYHTGVFGFTGTGKSNLTSILIRKLLEKNPEVKVVVFDIAGEYAVHLLDLLLSMGGVVYTTEPLTTERFIESQVVPDSLLEQVPEERVRKALAMINLRRVYIRKTALTMGDIAEMLRKVVEERPALSAMVDEALEIVTAQEPDLEYSRFTREYPEEASRLRNILSKIREKFSPRSYMYIDIEMVLVEGYREGRSEGVETVREVAMAAVTNPQHPPITIFYVPNPLDARMAASEFINTMFRVKKLRGLGNRIFIVLDEAQEFIPDRSRMDDYTYQSNLAVETLLRQGRKYGAGGLIATQRLAHLNTNALQQLHSYFVSTLPRTYDRNVVSDAFSISRSVVDKTTELDVGEWIFVSYKATKLKNVPVEIKAENNEEYVANFLLNLVNKEALNHSNNTQKPSS
jgi:molybdopterin-guanine dinucleotide biosynthesis protein